MDEVEKGLGAARGSDVDGGVSRRLFGSFLTWMQEKEASVFLVATANDLNALPPEFLRKGRFDEIFFVDLPSQDERKEIFEIQLNLRNQQPNNFDISRLAAASDGFSGAEIEQVVIGSLYQTLYERRPLATETMIREIQGTVPLSRTRMEEIEHLRRAAQGRFVPVR